MTTVSGDNALDLLVQIARLERERDQLRAELHHIRNHSLEWAMTCEHNCPACEAMYEVIKGAAS